MRAIDNPYGITDHWRGSYVEAPLWEQAVAWHVQVRTPRYRARRRERYQQDKAYQTYLRRKRQTAMRVGDAEMAPACRCGCGELVRSRQNGVWGQWRPGHHVRGAAIR